VLSSVVRAESRLAVQSGHSVAHNGKPNFRHPERFAATTNGLRTERTDHPLAAAEATGVSQSVATWTEIRDGGRVSEEDPLPSEEVGPKMRGAAEALRHVEDVVVKAGGAALRFSCEHALEFVWKISTSEVTGE